MTLHTDRTTLRPFGDEDVDAVVALLSEPSVRRWWGAYDAARLRAEREDDDATIWWTIRVGDELAGFVQAWEENEPDYRHAGLDISLAPAHQDQGLGREVLTRLVDWLVEERGHHRVTIDPSADNPRAIACYRAVGFQPVGVMRAYWRDPEGTWHDGLLMELIRAR